MSASILAEYRKRFGGLEGFFLPLAMATWDLLFQAQAAGGVRGGFLEIGVFKGKSAALGAMYMKPDEPCCFIDKFDVPVARQAISSIRNENSLFLKMNSRNALHDPSVRELQGKLRWIHIDGEHTGHATRVDLDTAAALLGDGGVICVDDFFSFKYPQLTAAVYAFLMQNEMKYRMVLASANKCYICQSDWVSHYDSYVREHAIRALDLEANGWTLARTSYLHDYGCFSIILRNKERDFVGLDRDIDAQVF